MARTAPVPPHTNGDLALHNPWGPSCSNGRAMPGCTSHRDVVSNGRHDLFKHAAMVGCQLVGPVPHIHPAAPLNIKAAFHYLEATHCSGATTASIMKSGAGLAGA